MNISDREDELESGFIALIALPEVGEGSTHEGSPQDGKNNATGKIDKDSTGESAPNVERASTGVHTPDCLNKNPVLMRLRDPALKVCILALQEIVLSSSTHSINFPELTQFMMMFADMENCVD